MKKWELYLGGDNEQGGARWSEARVHATLKEQGQTGATLIPCVGIWEGTREGSWQIVLFLGNGEIEAREIAKALCVEFNQQCVAVVAPNGDVLFVNN